MALGLLGGFSRTQIYSYKGRLKSVTMFGKPAHGDLDGDGEEDAVVLIMQDPGGSGTFYYVGAALKRNPEYKGTNTVLLGDRIAPRTIRILDGVVVVTYADRRPDETMAAPPSVKKTKYLKLKRGQLVEIGRPKADPEGRPGP